MTENNGGLDAINEALNRSQGSFHIKTLLISGLGFFTDAYDLFIIGVVVSLLSLSGWTTIDTFYKGLISSTSLISAVIGAILFGRLLDYLGRKRIYGLELAILIIGALGSAFLTPYNNAIALIGWRFLLGIGIGGDYAASSTIMAEYSNTKSRGKFIGSILSMQSFGLIAGPLIALAFMLHGVSPAITWKALLAIGAIPAAIVIYFRLKMPEPPRYTAAARGDVNKAARDLKEYTGINVSVSDDEKYVVKAKWSTLFRDRTFLLTLIGTMGAWFLMDWALYGNSIMSTTILSALVPSTIKGMPALIKSTEYTLLIFAVAAFPGYWIATFTIDRIGRKTIQLTGFAVMAATYAIIAIGYHSIIGNLSLFLGLYGVSYFFIMFGPNVTTFVYPPEVFPVTTRGLGTGMSAAGGKTGAFIGTFVDAIILGTDASAHLPLLFTILAIFAIVAFILTLVLLPETKGRNLEETSGEKRYTVKA
ncbi:MFS transporter [Thermoplasma sp.]|uniref:MFS transporter n=1 Tax=Thermoplasma sp. TaxID=1973142 RepID=UPI002605777E|nr:MFS transporter [Thermoplasma sp.]